MAAHDWVSRIANVHVQQVRARPQVSMPVLDRHAAERHVQVEAANEFDVQQSHTHSLRYEESCAQQGQANRMLQSNITNVN
jgi:hypothetical protein